MGRTVLKRFLCMMGICVILALCACGRQEENNVSQTETEIQSDGTEANGNAGSPIVYMTTDLSPQGLQAIYEALGQSRPAILR